MGQQVLQQKSERLIVKRRNNSVNPQWPKGSGQTRKKANFD